MFRKIVTELAYSPALAGSLGSYIKQLRNERSKRQIGLIFVFLAVVIQLFAGLFPPESANAGNPSILIDGGVQSVDEYLDYYDQNAKNIRDMLSSLGINRADIAASKQAALPTSDTVSFWSMQNDRSENSTAYSFQMPSGKMGIAFHQPLNPSVGPPEVFVGTASQSGDWFAITKKGGNLITGTSDTSGCPAWFSTSIEQSSTTLLNVAGVCPPTLQPSLSVRAIMHSSSSAPSIANTSDRIAYTLSITNNSSATASVSPAINLEDVLEYARILDNGGGEYDYDTRMLKWPAVALSSQEKTERSFIIQLLPTIPSTARGEFIEASYDCRLQASFGNTIIIPVNCPPVKYVEQLTRTLIDTPKWVSLLCAACLLAISSFLYARSRELLTELYIIRHNHLGGL